MNHIAANLAVAAAFAANKRVEDVPADTFRAGYDVVPTVDYVAPAMAPRPDGMSRQVQRSLYRKLCKRAGLDWRRKRN